MLHISYLKKKNNEYKQASGTGMPSHVPVQTLGHYILDLNPSTVSAETASAVSPFQVAIVLGQKETFSPSVYAFGMGSGTPIPSISLRQVLILVNGT